MTALSHDKGATDVPLIEQTIGAYFDAACAKHATREALVSRHQNDRLTYAELRRRVDAVACSLMRLGLEKGDRVAIWSQNNVEWLLTQHATAKAGLVLVNINPAYRRAELEYAINKVGCRAIVLSPAFKTSNYLEMLNDLAPELASAQPGALKAAKLPTLQFVIRMGEEKTPGMYNFGDLLAPPSDAEKDRLAALGATLKADEPINIQFTSGTTGNPKGATLTHRNILNNGFFVGEAIRLTEKDKICVPVPLYHCFGMV
ncbi:MAG: AMP-binding protein, partial [Rhodoblastus sp.]